MYEEYKLHCTYCIKKMQHPQLLILVHVLANYEHMYEYFRYLHVLVLR